MTKENAPQDSTQSKTSQTRGNIEQIQGKNFNNAADELFSAEKPLSSREVFAFNLAVKKEDIEVVYKKYKNNTDPNKKGYDDTKKYYMDGDIIKDYDNGQELKDIAKKIADTLERLSTNYATNQYTGAFVSDIGKSFLEAAAVGAPGSLALLTEKVNKLENGPRTKSEEMIDNHLKAISKDPKFDEPGNKELKEQLGELLALNAGSLQRPALIGKFIKACKNKELLSDSTPLSSSLKVIEHESQLNIYPLLSNSNYSYATALKDHQETLNKLEQIEKRFEQQPTIAYGTSVKIMEPKPTREDYIKAMTRMVADQKQITGLDPNSPNFKEELSKLDPKQIGKLEIAFVHITQNERGVDQSNIVAYKIDPKDFIKIMQKMDTKLIQDLDPNNLATRKDLLDEKDPNKPMIDRLTRGAIKDIRELVSTELKDVKLEDVIVKRNNSKIEKDIEKGKKAASQEAEKQSTSPSSTGKKADVRPEDLLFPKDVAAITRPKRVEYLETNKLVPALSTTPKIEIGSQKPEIVPSSPSPTVTREKSVLPQEPIVASPHPSTPIQTQAPNTEQRWTKPGPQLNPKLVEETAKKSLQQTTAGRIFTAKNPIKQAVYEVANSSVGKPIKKMVEAISRITSEPTTKSKLDQVKYEVSKPIKKVIGTVKTELKKTPLNTAYTKTANFVQQTGESVKNIAKAENKSKAIKTELKRIRIPKFIKDELSHSGMHLKKQTEQNNPPNKKPPNKDIQH